MIETDYLYKAVLENDIEHAFQLLQGQANVNALDNRGEPPVFEAVRNGNPLMLQLLINYGADLMRIGVDGWNVLHYAVHAKQYEMLRCLVDNAMHFGQSPPMQSVNKLGCTPLHFAQCPFDIQKFALLLTFYGKQLYLKEVDCPANIEHLMLDVLIDRYCRTRLLDIVLTQVPDGIDTADRLFIIRTIFLVASSKENHIINHLISMMQQAGFDQSRRDLDYTQIFQNHPILGLYSRDVLNSTLIFLFAQLSPHIKDKAQYKAFVTQVKQDAHDEVRSMTYYRKQAVLSEKPSRPFKF